MCVLSPRHRRYRVRLHARGRKLEEAAGRRAGIPRLGQGAPLFVGLRPCDGHLRLQREDRRTPSADDRARIRRRGQLLSRRPVDRVLVHARRLQPPIERSGREAARDRPQLFR